MCLTETHITSDIEPVESEIEGYVYTQCLSESRHTGGSLIYVRKDINFETIKTKVIPGNMWIVLIKLKIVNDIWYIGSIYHSPNSSHAEFIVYFEEICEELLLNGEKFFIMGDINIDFNVDTYYSNKLKTCLKDLGLYQMVKSSTRITETSDTLIDLVITNYKYIETNVLHAPRISDHSMANVSFKSVVQSKTVKMLHMRAYKHINKDYFKQSLLNLDWNFKELDVDTMTEKFMKNIEKTIEKVTPIIMVFYR